MSIIESVLLLIGLVLIGNVISHYLTSIPVGLIQILLGLGAALFLNFEIPLKSDWFMLLFVAPLLFNDGRRFPKKELWELRGPIVANAIILVFITTFAGGLFINWLLPDMPLSAAFALAAILSPTDPVAVHSISKSANLPTRVLHLVSGESLINDASGLIGFKYGIAATVTGAFSLSHAIGDFFYVGIVGALIGIVLLYAVHLLRLSLMQQGINDVVLHTILQLLIPFVIYLIAEDIFHASGVIAVVAAGILHKFTRNAYANSLSELKIVTEKTWDIVIYLLNGVVFLILGIELPVAMGSTIKNPLLATEQAILYTFLVWFVILGIRMAWTWIYLWVGNRHSEDKHISPRVILVSGLSGVRGAITMAGVLSVPFVLDSGKSFPDRSLMLFIAAGVIILSLVAAVVFIPFLTKKSIPIVTRGSLMNDEEESESDSKEMSEEGLIEEHRLSEIQARQYIMQLAVKKLESIRREENQRVILDLLAEYQNMIHQLELSMQSDEMLAPFADDELLLRQIALHGEEARLQEMYENQEISEKGYQIYFKKLSYKENYLDRVPLTRNPSALRILFAKTKVNLKKIGYFLTHWNKKKMQVANTEQRLIEKECAKAAIKNLSQFLKEVRGKGHDYNRQIIYQIILGYRRKIEYLKPQNHRLSVEEYEQMMQELRLQAIAVERTGIQELLEQGYITKEVAIHLRRYVNFSESALIMTLEMEGLD